MKTIRFEPIISYFILGVITLYFFLCGIPGIYSLEFVARTEADRALIAWEMLERGTSLVPYLLGDTYITKPPLYYVLLEQVFSYVGSAEVWAARMPSLVSATLLLIFHFVFLRQVGWTQAKAVVSTIMLASSVQFIAYSLKAEIDMVFTLLCSLSLYTAYLIFRNERSARILAFLCFLSLVAALFTKGPPVLIFYLAGFFSFFLFKLFSEDRKALVTWLAWKGSLLLAALTFAVVLMVLWCLHLSEEMSAGNLYLRFDQELLGRFRESLGRKLDRGVTYYPIGFVASALPWSLLLLTLFFLKFLLRTSTTAEAIKRMLHALKRDSLLVYASGLIVCSILVFSLAQSKANRYLLPLLPWMMVLLTSLVWKLRERELPSFFKYLSVIGLTVSIPLGLVSFYYQSPSIAGLCFAGITLPFFLLFLDRSNHYFTLHKFMLLGLCLLSLKLPFAFAYAAYRNSSLSVTSIARDINQAVPEGATIYTLEMWQRWLLYYLKKEGRVIHRVTPAIATRLSQDEREVHLIVTSQDEHWRLKEILQLDSSAKLLYQGKTKKHVYFLIRMNSAELSNLVLKEVFPVTPTPIPEQYRLAARELSGIIAKLSSQ